MLCLWEGAKVSSLYVHFENEIEPPLISVRLAELNSSLQTSEHFIAIMQFN